MRLTLVNSVCGTVMLLAVLAGVFTLAWHGTISGGEAMTVVVSIVSLAGGIFAVHSGVNAGAQVNNPTEANNAPH